MENAVTMQDWLPTRTELYLENAVTMQDWLPTKTELYLGDAVTMQEWLFSKRTELKNIVAMQEYWKSEGKLKIYAIIMQVLIPMGIRTERSVFGGLE